jgi:hypothetical protein
MSQRIDQLCENPRLKLTSIDNGLNSVKAKIDRKAKDAEQGVRGHLDKVEKRIESDRAKLTAAQSEAKNRVEERKNAERDKIAEWKAKLEASKLQNRADRAEHYAAAAIVIAGAAVDEAERAALEAWLARQDATPA